MYYFDNLDEIESAIANLNGRVCDLEEKIDNMKKEKRLRDAYDVLKNKEPLTEADKLVLSMYQKFNKTVDMSLDDAMHILLHESGYWASLRNLKDEVDFGEYGEYGEFFDIFDRRVRDSRLLKKISNPINADTKEIILRDLRLGE